MYEFYLDKIMLPVAPGKLQLSIENQNKTLQLINEGEINLLKKAGLTDLEFEALLPNSTYPFASYKNGYQEAEYYLNELEKLKISLEPFQFIVTRQKGAKQLFSTNMKVSLEEYKIKEDSKEGFDLLVNIKLKQYQDYGPKTYKVMGDKVSTEKQRETKNSPAPKSTAKTHKVKSGDTLWLVAKKYYGNGSKYKALATANKISNPNVIKVGQVLTIPPL